MKKKIGQGFKELYKYWSDIYKANNRDYKKGQQRLIKAKTFEEAEKALNLISGSMSNITMANNRINSLITAAEDILCIEWDKIKENL